LRRPNAPRRPPRPPNGNCEPFINGRAGSIAAPCNCRDSAKTYENPARGTACWATDFSDPLGPESARDGRPKLAAHRIGLLPIVTHRASGVDCRTERLERPRAVPSGLFRWPRDLVSRTRRVQKWSIELVLTKISLCLANLLPRTIPLNEESGTIYQPDLSKGLPPTPNEILEQLEQPKLPGGRFAGIIQAIVPRRRRASRGGTGST
jgi:hypothetical protein